MGGEVCIMLYYQTFVHFHETVSFTNGWMLDFFDLIELLLLRKKNHFVFIVEKWWKLAAMYITIFVNSSRNHCPAVFTIPCRKIGAPSQKRNPKWSPCNNHFIY
jgi:hypothetical protein